ncbi:hypothetical protein FO519_004273 [Halicephalobus sp. NKZ332]|nr:hypothetical protein FO519_004273 [Halicephalobus sp. NKZ332]
MSAKFDHGRYITDNDWNNNTDISTIDVVIESNSSSFNSGVREAPPKPNTVLGRWKTRFRFLLAVLMLFCLTSVWSNIICFNFALICITPHDDDQGRHDEYNDLKGAHFTSTQQMYLTSAVALAGFIGNFIAVQLITRYGVRSVFTPLGLLSAVSTALFPVALKSGFVATLILRFLQGFAFSANFPVIGSFTSKWAYHKQSGLIVSTLVAYIQLSPTLSDPISGALCESDLGWQSVFYGHALVCAFLFSLFGKHPFVGHHELYKVSANKVVQSKKELRNIPYKAILKTPAVWAVWIAGIGNFVCVNTVFLYSPNYIHYVLKMNVSSTGAMSAVPAILQFLVKLSGGITSDKVRCLKENNKLRLYNTLAFFLAAIFLIILSFMPTDKSTICFIILSIGTGCLGLTTGGFFKSGPLIAQQYSQFVTGNISQAITTTMILVPFVIAGLAPNNTATDWQHVFWFVAAILIVTNVIFCIFCSGIPAEWTKLRNNQNVESEKPGSKTFATSKLGQIYPKK